MGLLLSISFRNLLRQKRRNIFLGTAIAFGTMILIIASSFSHGITDVLFNRIVKYANGHVSITCIRNGNLMNPLFPDADRIWKVVKEEAPASELTQEAIGMFARGIGNGKADNVIMVGIDLDATMSKEDLKEYQANFKFVDGEGFESLKNDSSPEVPVAIAEQKAKYLNLKKGDILRVRFSDARNQAQSAQLKVAAIFKPANILMAAPIFLNLKDVRRLGGYGPHDVATIQINIKDPQKNAKVLADRIHARLTPGLAVIPGTITAGKRMVQGFGMGMLADTVSHHQWTSRVALLAGDSAKAFGYEGVVIAHTLARTLGVSVADTVYVSWKGLYDSVETRERLVVSGVADSAAPIPSQCVLMNERTFYNAFYRQWPMVADSALKKALPDSLNPLFASLTPEYRLMKRCKTTEEVVKIMRETGRAKYKGIMVQIQSMYETASAILKLEAVLNLITMIAVLILFFIILIGVLNTLRMTIRERTREIGTIRAIGMQKNDVRNIFVFETMFLALFSATAGIIAGFIGMAGLSLLKLDAGDNPLGMLLVQGHLHFVPTVGTIVFFFLFIMLFAMATAYFPARRAAKLSAAEALRHYE